MAEKAPATKGRSRFRLWLFTIAARLVFKLRLFEAVTLILDRGVSNATNRDSRSAGITVRRRGRYQVLAYHRVNDDNHPFFAGVSRSLF